MPEALAGVARTDRRQGGGDGADTSRIGSFAQELSDRSKTGCWYRNKVGIDGVASFQDR